MGRSIQTGTADGGGGIGSLNAISNKIASIFDNDNIEFEPRGSGNVVLVKNTPASSTSTGALVVEGGVGIGGNLFTGGEISTLTFNVSGLATLNELTEITSSISGATGIVEHNFENGGIFYHSNINSNFTANFTNVPTTDNRGIAIVLILSQEATGRYPSAIQINGAAVTLRWANDSVPTPGSNRIDLATFTLIRVFGTWIVLGNYTNYS